MVVVVDVDVVEVDVEVVVVDVEVEVVEVEVDVEVVDVGGIVATGAVLVVAVNAEGSRSSVAPSTDAESASVLPDPAGELVAAANAAPKTNTRTQSVR